MEFLVVLAATLTVCASDLNAINPVSDARNLQVWPYATLLKRITPADKHHCNTETKCEEQVTDSSRGNASPLKKIPDNRFSLERGITSCVYTGWITSAQALPWIKQDFTSGVLSTDTRPSQVMVVELAWRNVNARQHEQLFNPPLVQSEYLAENIWPASVNRKSSFL